MPRPLNIHHLELFYYVARHGGVSAAARHIPYGIQQPAISAQIIQLENELGATLFRRRPFALTRAGEEMLRFIEPFFSGLDDIAQKIRGGTDLALRIGAPDSIQRQYLPRLLKSLRERFPGLHFTLKPLRTERLVADLLGQEYDVGIAPVQKIPDGIECRELISVPVALVAPRRAKITAAEQLWKLDRIAEPLITGSVDGSIYRHFQAELLRRKIDWFPSLMLNSQETICQYVAEGFGFGLILVEPGIKLPAGVRMLALDGFPPLTFGLYWTGLLSPLHQAFLEEAERLAKLLRAEDGA